MKPIQDVVRSLKGLDKFTHTRKIKRSKRVTVVQYSLIFENKICKVGDEQKVGLRVATALADAGHSISEVTVYQYAIDIYQDLPPDEDGTLLNSFPQSWKD